MGNHGPSVLSKTQTVRGPSGKSLQPLRVDHGVVMDMVMVMVMERACNHRESITDMDMDREWT